MRPPPERASMLGSGMLPGSRKMSPSWASRSSDWVNRSRRTSRERVTRRIGPTTLLAVNPLRFMVIVPGRDPTLSSVLRP